MSRYVDYIDNVMGPQSNDCRISIADIEEIELSLVKLYHATGENRYLRLSQYFVDERGKQPSFLQEEETFGGPEKTKWFDLEYHQAHTPIKGRRKR